MTAQRALTAGKAFDDLAVDQQARLTVFRQATQQFIDADKVIIANPLWNLMIPGKLKAWFDTICVEGQTFETVAVGERPLAPGKHVLHIQAAGGVTNGQNLASRYVKDVMTFLGAQSLRCQWKVWTVTPTERKPLLLMRSKRQKPLLKHFKLS